MGPRHLQLFFNSPWMGCNTGGLFILVDWDEPQPWNQARLMVNLENWWQKKSGEPFGKRQVVAVTLHKTNSKHLRI